MSFKVCPNGKHRRPATEIFCQELLQDGLCGWDLTTVQVEIEPKQQPSPPSPEKIGAAVRCRNGHPIRSGDLFCPVCEAEIDIPAQPPGLSEGDQPPYDPGPSEGSATPSSPVAQPSPAFGTWMLVRRIGREDRGTETWVVRRQNSTVESAAILVLHPKGTRIDAAAASAAATGVPGFAQVLDGGEYAERPFEVYSTEGLRTLSEVLGEGLAPDKLRNLIAAIAGILADLGRLGVRHRDLCPEAILVDGPSIERVTLSRLGAALHSSNELDTAPPPELTHYAAPELLAGALTAASDWWSLGIVILEVATRGACFTGIDDQAFLMQVVAGAVEIPDTLEPEIGKLLQGLLAKDRIERWQGEQVVAWLTGVPVALPVSSPAPREDEAGEITLSGRPYRRVSAYALAAGRKEKWEEARTQLVHGRLSAWLESFSSAERVGAAIRNVVRRDDIDDDTKLSLALKYLNEDMPLVRAGDIVTPAWLLQHPEDGYALVTSPAPDLLPSGAAEAWLLRLKQRAAEVRRRLKSLEIEVDEPSLRLHLLATSRAQLNELWDQQRRSLPDSEHRGIAALFERAALRDEDLIILLSAAKSQFVPLSEAVAAASQLAGREGIATFEGAKAGELLLLQRRELMDLLDERIEGFARSDHERINAWVDQYRLEKRIPLARVLVLLSLPPEAWKKPPRQDYVAQLLEHFEKRIGTSVSRGALARMTIGKTSPRIDLTEIGTRRVSASALLDHLIERGESAIDIDPAAFDDDGQLEHRLRRLARNADLQRRETGINGLYLGFPFVLMRPRGDAGKPRIAPLLLWPAVIHAEVGQRARFRLAFDRDREEVRLNPALQGMLAPDALSKWEEACDRALSGTAKAAAVIDELSMLAKVRERQIAKLPVADTKVSTDAIELSWSAVLFHVMFVGQSIVNDIHQLQSIPPAGTGLETLLRSGAEQAPVAEHTSRPEVDRYITAESDPTQDRAVARARSGPGLVIEGPPGTGKSQTIVNLVADAIGRKKSLLLVCQKQAALDVVYKRLERDGLGGRIMMVKDPTKDRRAVLEQIRDQLVQTRAPRGNAASLQRRRKAVVDRIAGLEAQLNERHDALRKRDDVSGKTYRETIEDLIRIESDGPVPDVVDLRRLLGSRTAEDADAAAEQCGALASQWLLASYEDSPLHAMKAFAVDAGAMEQCQRDIEAFTRAEKRRADAIDPSALSIKVKDPAALGTWATQNASVLVRLDAVACVELGRLVGAFEDGPPSRGSEAIDRVTELEACIAAVPDQRADARLARLLSDLGDLELDGWIETATDALKPRSWLMRLLGGGKSARRKLGALLAVITPAVSDPVIKAFADAAIHQRTLRALELLLDELRQSLGEGATSAVGVVLSKGKLAAEAHALAVSLERVNAIHGVLARSPARKEAIDAARKGKHGAFATLFDAITRALTLHSSSRASLDALKPLTAWFADDWIAGMRSSIEGGQSTVETLARFAGALPTLAYFQRFRARAGQLSPLAFEAYAALRSIAVTLDADALARPGNVIERTIKREARLGWKERIETASPMLGAEEAEIASLVITLAAAEEDLKRINKEMLADNIEVGRLGTATNWDNITRFTGPRSRRLREFLELGSEIGLMELRPVWLMSPDVASRLLPLEKGLFDTIVYDEASQMPVEYALPTLYRGRTVVVSGDEKQLPPTSFFTIRTTQDADGSEFDDARDEFDESEHEAAIESWNRREIQDCPNLLELSKSVLPSEQLQVHYRSEYRELITFSNAGFYAGALNVPVRHTEAEVDHHRPLELIHVGGLYKDRTNAAEADRLVEQLEHLWLRAKGKPPTTGVVTFNRDQADLIEERLEKRAEANEEFRHAYVRETERFENGEDMGFFVKNVENVQGDERDHILFSTTFGRNPLGQFRRTFGVLGQSGGERRLNVAVTRARRRITIFTSMPIEEISEVLGSGGRPSQPRDYLQLYLAYADAVSRCEHERARGILAQLGSVRSLRGRVNRAVTSDAFVQSVAAAVEEMGWRPVHAGDGSAFGIDLAIPRLEGGGFGLGIECDAADHPLLVRPHAREIWRLDVMRRSLPAIHRIACRDWYHGRAREIAKLRSAIDAAMRSSAPVAHDRPMRKASA